MNIQIPKSGGFCLNLLIVVMDSVEVSIIVYDVDSCHIFFDISFKCSYRNNIDFFQEL